MDPGGPRDSAAVRDAFAALARSLKRISVFRHARDQHAAYLEPALASLRELLERQPSITVELEPMGLRLADEMVHSEPAREGGFCFRLHRDGVRTLTFRRGLGLEDLTAFSRVAMADPQESSEDAVTELWKLDLTHVSYSAISGYRMKEAGGETMSKSIADIAERAQQTLDGRIGESFAEPGQKPALWSEEQRAKGDPQDWAPLARRGALTILRIVEQDNAGWDLEALQESFWRLIDEMCERGEVQVIALALDRARRIGGAHSQDFRAAVGKKLAEPRRLERAIKLGAGAEKPPLLASWLALLSPEEGGTIATLLALAETPASRASLAVAAVARYDSARSALLDVLRGGGAQDAQAVIAASSTLPVARRTEVAAAASAHPNPLVQVQAIPLLGGDAASVQKLGGLLRSPARDVRLAAAQGLSAFTLMVDAAANQLLAAIRRSKFGKLDREEQTAVYRALGKLGSAPGFAFLLERLTRPARRLFKRRREAEQLLAVQGLAEEASQRSLRALEDVLLPSRNHPPGVVAASRAAAQHVRAAQRGGKTA